MTTVDNAPTVVIPLLADVPKHRASHGRKVNDWMPLPVVTQLRNEIRFMDRKRQQMRLSLVVSGMVVLTFFLIILFAWHPTDLQVPEHEPVPGVTPVFNKQDGATPVAYLVTLQSGVEFLCTRSSDTPHVQYTCDQLDSSAKPLPTS